MADEIGMDIDRLAQLARMTLSDEEKTSYAAQLRQILDYFEELQKVDVTGIEPMAHPYETSGLLREDKASEAWEPTRALGNGPCVRENQIVVPKVVEDA